MNAFFSVFQITGLALIIAMTFDRAFILYTTQGINPLVVGRGKTGFRLLLELGFLFVGLFWAFLVLMFSLDSFGRFVPFAWDARLVPPGAWQWIGVAFNAAGLLIFAAALASFGKSWRVGIDEKRAGELVTGGIFALSRNPIFIFLDLYFVGTFLINGTLLFLVFAAVIMLGVHFQILEEESFLRRRYGTAYESYCRRTGRYFGKFARG
jgi:protein-S-isoprenylcysteine O-methyltransferase Ste14